MIWLLVLIVLAVTFVLVMAGLDAKKYQTKTTDELVGICTTTLDRTTKKDANLQTITSLLQARGELTNTALRAELKVSSRTIIRYMDELEQKGVVVQVGKTGQSTSYRLK